MNHVWEYGSARGACAVYPLLMECDRRGHVLWMSDEARSVFGAADNLVDAIPPGVPAGAGGSLRRVAAVCLVRLLERGDSVLLGVQCTELEEDTARLEVTNLLLLQDNLLRHYFRLQHAERGLSTRARQNRPGGGRQSILQIERERQRLGRELHTGVGQILAAIRLQLEIIGAYAPQPAISVQQALGRISTLANDALEQVRSVSRRLHPPEWQRLTLEAALRQMWETSGVAERFQASLHIAPLTQEPDLAVKVLLYRAAQEALSNLTRHSRATSVDLTLELRGETLVLTVRDNGVGFDVRRQFSAPPRIAEGIGLRSIREQAAYLGGKLAVESSPAGTTLEVSAPFPPQPS